MSPILLSPIRFQRIRILPHTFPFYLSHHAVHCRRSIPTVHSSTHHLFDEIPQQNSIAYDSLIAAQCSNGHVDDACALIPRMMAGNHRPTRFTFVPILSSQYLDISRGTQLHNLLLKTGLLHSDPYSATGLMGHYAKRQRMDIAVELFDEMPIRTVVTWNSIIYGFSQMGCVQNAILLFRELLRSEVEHSDCSFLSVLSAFCKTSECLYLLDQLHGLVIKLAMDCYAVVSNALLNAYSNCFAAGVSERLFSDLPVKDLVSWNTNIAAFARSETPERALEIFFRMLVEGVYPNESTLASVLVACVGVNSTVYGRLIHARAIKHNLSTSVYVGTSLVDFYAKCKRLEDAHNMFGEIPGKNVVTWNALISGYSNGDCVAMLLLLEEMLRSGFVPNEFTFSSILRKADASILGQLHSLIIRLGYENNDYVSSALITSYGAHDMIADALACSSTLVSPVHVAPRNVIAGIYNRMGRYEDTKEMLLSLHYPDAISWSILLAACARNEDYFQAFLLLTRMQISGYLLDNYMAVSLLSICSKINNLGLGSTLHGLIIKNNAGYSEVFVSNVLMHMYAKCGSLDGCLRVFHEMSERNFISWTTLISGLGLHGCTHEALERFRQMESIGWKADRVVFLAVLSACRHGGLVEQGMMLFEKMKTVYGIQPEMDHYTILVDLLCTHGHLNEAENVIRGMPFQPNAVIWRIFLQGCKMYR